mmetsp:Transcript_14768/g.41149  ORF Transcript_14768/g.41149 Transcript_14768/m.41149 type:complete len:90 (-) Transcript_14768:49-318(-)
MCVQIPYRYSAGKTNNDAEKIVFPARLPANQTLSGDRSNNGWATTTTVRYYCIATLSFQQCFEPQKAPSHLRHPIPVFSRRAAVPQTKL